MSSVPTLYIHVWYTSMLYRSTICSIKCMIFGIYISVAICHVHAFPTYTNGLCTASIPDHADSA